MKIEWNPKITKDLTKYKYAVQEYARYNDDIKKFISFFRTKDITIDIDNLTKTMQVVGMPFLTQFGYMELGWMFSSDFNRNVKWFLYDNEEEILKDYFEVLLKKNFLKKKENEN